MSRTLPHRRRSIGVLELLTNGPTDHYVQQTLVAPNFAGVMPQVVAVWAEQAGATVHYDVYTGRENPFALLSRGLDVLFLSCFTRGAFLAYAIAARARAMGITVVLGGPHARSFHGHAARYVDYVCKLADRALITELVLHAEPQPRGRVLGTDVQPRALPTLRARARFVDHAVAKASPLLRGVPMLGSIGCPYDCSFCIDATVPYQPFPFDELREDLRFIEQRYGEGTFAMWHDPNFGVRFREYMELIESSGTRLRHVAEASLSLLKEPNLRAMERNRFVMLLPGVESWVDYNAKSGVGGRLGEAKVDHVAEHFTLIERHVPGVQANFILGLDDARGDEPWELTKRFVDRTSPGIFPGYFLMTDFHNAPVSSLLQAERRSLATPFPLLDNLQDSNVRPRHYDPIEFLERTIDLLEHTFSREQLWKRFRANRTAALKVMNVGRAVTEGLGMIDRRKRMLAEVRADRATYAFRNGEEGALPPQSMFDEVRRGLGTFASAVPEELMRPASFVATLRAPEQR